MQWQLGRATHEVVLLLRGDQYAIIDASASRMRLRSYETYRSGTVIDV
jgi:hypothetical protein